MENKRLEQEIDARQHATPSGGGRDYKTALERTEELHGISPAFRKIAQNPVQPSPAQWRQFSQKLNLQLEASQAPFFQTLRDKLVASDGHLLHWFWILLALLILVIAAAVVAFSVSEPTGAIALRDLASFLGAVA